MIIWADEIYSEVELDGAHSGNVCKGKHTQYAARLCTMPRLPGLYHTRTIAILEGERKVIRGLKRSRYGTKLAYV